MKLILGLGNPGGRYANTRHNAGRSLVEWVAKKNNAGFKEQKKLKASIARISIESQEVILAFPETYMNVSGEAAASLILQFSTIPEQDFLVIVDDVSLPFGKFRLRSRGSDGGHNGLKSIHASIGTQAYARLRFGVGAPDPLSGIPLEEFVLCGFEKSERSRLPEIYERGRQALNAWVSQPIAKAMNSVNP